MEKQGNKGKKKRGEMHSNSRTKIHIGENHLQNGNVLSLFFKMV
jgi:hypothetical protein